MTGSPFRSRVAAAITALALVASGALAAAPATADTGYTPQLVGTVSGTPSGTTPTAIELSPDGSRLYTTNYSRSTLSIIDTATEAQIAEVPVGSLPMDLAVSPDGSRVYVADWIGNSVTIVDTATATRVGTVAGFTGRNPRGIAISPDGSTVYTANGNSSVSIISTATATQTGTVTGFSGTVPWSVVVSPDGRTVYTANLSSRNVSVIDAALRTELRTVPVGEDPARIAVSPDSSTVYVANSSSGTLSVITRAGTTVRSVAAGSRPYGVAVSKDGASVYVVDRVPGRVLVLDAATQAVTRTIAAGRGANDVAVTADQRTAYTSDESASTVSILALAARASLSPATQSLSATAGRAISATSALTASGFDGAVTYTIEPALPAGLQLDATTGSITGTPTAAQTSTEHTITASRGALSARATIGIAVAAALTPASQTVSGTVGAALTETAHFETAGLVGTVAYSLSPSSLPRGLAFDSTTGAISGTPEVVISPLRYSVSATDGSRTASGSILLRVDPVLSPSSLVLHGSAGLPVEATAPLTTTGFPTAPTFSVEPALPTGLVLDESTGAVSGTPDAAGDGEHTITASNGFFSASTALSLRIAGLTPPRQTVDAVHGVAIAATAALDATGLLGEVTYAVAPALPAGLAIDAATGVVSGTPSGAAQAPTEYTITAIGAESGTALAVVTIAVDAAATPSTQQVEGTVGTAIDRTSAITASGLSSPVTYTVSPALPEGLELDGLTGSVSGTPVAAQQRTTYTITAQSLGFSASATLTLEFAATLAPNARAVQATAGEPLEELVFRGAGFGGPVVFTVTPALPEGLRLDAATGALDGTPSAAQALERYLVTADDGEFSASAALSIRIAGLAPSTQSVELRRDERMQATAALSTTGFSGAVAYAVSPALPAGLSIDAATGAVSGTPSGSAQVVRDYTITATGAVAGRATATLAIGIAPDLAAPAATLRGSVGEAFGPTPAPAASGFPAAVAYSISPALPEGLVLDVTTGTISGAPISAIDRTEYVLTASGGGFSQRTSIAIAVAGLTATPSSISAAHGTPIAPTPAPSTTGIEGEVRYSISPALPAGLHLDAATGVISGTPTGRVQPSSEHRLQAVGSLGGSAQVMIAIEVLASAPAAPTGATATGGARQAHVSWTPSADDGGTGPVRYTVTAPDGSTCTTTGTWCVITGLPAGTIGFTVTASTTAGGSAAIATAPVEVTGTTAPATVPAATDGPAVRFLDRDGHAVETVRPGQRVTVVASGFAAGSLVDAYVYSQPVLLGSARTDEQGAAEFAVTVPEDLPTGAHTLVAIGLDERGATAVATTAVVAELPSATPAATTTDQPGLARTGAETAGPLLGALALLLLGALLAAAGLRRRPVR